MRYFLTLIVTAVSNWFIFKKMGREGWEALIPIYSVYVLFEELYGSGWRFLLLLIPLFNLYVAVRFCVDLARSFGKSAVFAVGLMFLNPVFSAILAFDNSAVYYPLV